MTIDEEAFKAWCAREYVAAEPPVGTSAYERNLLLRSAWAAGAAHTASRLVPVPVAPDDASDDAAAARQAAATLHVAGDQDAAARAYARAVLGADGSDDDAYWEVETSYALQKFAAAWLAGYGTRLSAPRCELRPHGAPHERLAPDEIEYAVARARAYAVCCSQRNLEDVNELRGAHLAGFKSACAYLRAPGIERAAIVPAPEDPAT